jgi:hypothetical protein
MLASYAVLIAIYFLPAAAWYLATSVTEDSHVLDTIRWLGLGSPLMTAFWVPLESNMALADVQYGWMLVLRYLLCSIAAIGIMFAATSVILRNRLGMTGR